MITAINNYNTQCRKPQVKFTAGKNQSKLAQATIDRLGLNMKARIGYNGPGDYTPAPDNIKPKLREYFHKLEINWQTHIDPNKPRKSYE